MTYQGLSHEEIFDCLRLWKPYSYLCSIKITLEKIMNQQTKILFEDSIKKLVMHMLIKIFNTIN